MGIKTWGNGESIKEIKESKPITTKPKYKKKEKSKERGEQRKTTDFGLLLVVMFGAVVMMAMVFSSALFDGISNDLVEDDTYTIQIYIPDCNGELFYEKSNISASFLLNNGLGKRKSMFNNMLEPSNDFSKYEDFIKLETGSPIPAKYICIEFTME